MKKISNWIASVYIAISVYVFFNARTFPEGTHGVLGPGFFPMVLSVIVILLSICQLIQSARQPKTEKDKSVTLFEKQNLRAWGALGLTVLYFTLIKAVGFLIATPIYLFAMLVYFRVKSWTVRIAVSLLSTGALYVIFTTLLHVQLPGGILF